MCGRLIEFNREYKINPIRMVTRNIKALILTISANKSPIRGHKVTERPLTSHAICQLKVKSIGYAHSSTKELRERQHMRAHIHTHTRLTVDAGFRMNVGSLIEHMVIKEQ